MPGSTYIFEEDDNIFLDPRAESTISKKLYTYIVYVG
jgi:hypothetical protein